MPTPILMPALSPTMTEGNLARWLKKEGDTVKSGDVIAEIETDKATMEVEAVDEGTLGKILVPEGTNDVAVNTPIAMILSEGEDASAIKGASSGAGKEGPASKTDGQSAKPAQQQKGEESAPPAAPDEPAAKEARAPAQPKSAVAAPPKPETIPEPDVPEGTEMANMTVR